MALMLINQRPGRCNDFDKTGLRKHEPAFVELSLLKIAGKAKRFSD